MDENSYQEKGYKLILDALQLRSANYDKYGKEREMPDFSNMEAFGYTYLQRPLEALTMVYPNVDIENNDFDKLDDDKKQDIVKHLVGKNGLANNIQYETNRNIIIDSTSNIKKRQKRNTEDF